MVRWANRIARLFSSTLIGLLQTLAIVSVDTIARGFNSVDPGSMASASIISLTERVLLANITHNNTFSASSLSAPDCASIRTMVVS